MESDCNVSVQEQEGQMLIIGRAKKLLGLEGRKKLRNAVPNDNAPRTAGYHITDSLFYESLDSCYVISQCR